MNRSSAVRALAARPIAALAALIALAALVNALLVGCGGGNKSDQSNANTGTSATPSTTTSTPSGGTTSEATGTTADADLGAKVYKERCVLCHGAEGKGDGVAAAGLNPKPRNHTDGSYMNSRTDDELLTVIRGGKGAMPAWGAVLSDAEIKAVLKHVRTLAVPPYKG